MALFKCKICGGDLAVTADMSVAECEYCGSMQTLPKVNDERLASFYDRANDLRMGHEFDKAAEIYEKIIEENPTDADAYWSMVLCRYGIEYVEESATSGRKPTINRAQLVSVFEDVNYRSAIKYADAAQKRVYEEEAARIDRILQRYLEISRNEPEYDVFICYKETGADGRRTLDSVRAGEIYRELTSEGFRVFFAPVTLENKLGEDYEPYIFSAIHSAKVMVVIGTKPEHFNAVWVKNEWSRFLTLAKDDPKKSIIPVYGGMDPYDMPEAFRFKQSQNMEKLGFMLDLVRGIEKLVGKNKPQPVSQPAARPAAPAPSANVDTLLQRVSIFLEDQDWGSANIYCEKVLDIAPTNGTAYFYKLLAEARVKNEGALQKCEMPLENLKAYKNAVRYADEATSSKLINYNQQIKDRLAQEEAERQERERRAAERREAQRRYAEERDRLRRAIDNASSRVSSLIHEKEQKEAEMVSLQDRTANVKKHKRKLRIRALLVLVTAVIIFIGAVNDSSAGIYPMLFILQFVLAILLANARDKSKVKAILLTLFTVGMGPFFSAVKALVEASRYSAKEIEDRCSAIRSGMQTVEEQLALSRQSLRELNKKLEELESTREEVNA